MRRERGSAVPLTTYQVKLADGSGAVHYGVDLTNAEIPDKTYFGEIGGVDYHRNVVRIMFAQPKLGTEELRSLVIISMNPHAAAYFSKSLDGMGSPSLEEILATFHGDPQALSAFPKEEPDQTASLIANIVAAAVHSYECCLDFYHVNAFAHLAVKNIAKARELYLEPVVRIQTSSALLLSLKTRLAQMRKDYPTLAAVEEVPNG